MTKIRKSPASEAKKPEKIYPPSAPSKRVFDPNMHCGAQLRNKERGRLCMMLKGMQTPHPGVGRCWLHGGLTPIKHGLTSLIKHDRLRDLITKIKDMDVDLMDLTPEIELMRAMIIDFVNRYDDFIDQLSTWYNAMDDDRSKNDLPPLPRKFPELDDAAQLLEAVSRIIERMHKIQREGSITLDVFRSLMGQMGMVVAKHVADETVLAAVEKDWSTIMVNPRSFVRDSGAIQPAMDDDA